MFRVMTPKKTSRYDPSNFQYYGSNFVNNIIIMNCTSIGKITCDSVCMTLNILDLMEGDLCIAYAAIYREIHSFDQKTISKKRF
jgi:hypothetical protein